MQRTAHKLLAGDSNNLHTTANIPKIQSSNFLMLSIFQLFSFSTLSVCLGAGMIDPLCKHHCQDRHNLLKLSIGSCCVLCLGISQAKPCQNEVFCLITAPQGFCKRKSGLSMLFLYYLPITNSCLGSSAHPVEIFGLRQW